MDTPDAVATLAAAEAKAELVAKHTAETAVAQFAATFTPAPIDGKTLDDLMKQVETAAQAAAATALTAKFGPMGGMLASALVGTLIEPLIGAIGEIVKHIGMAVPAAIGELTEKLESGIGLDLNGDGFVGDPAATASSSASADKRAA